MPQVVKIKSGSTYEEKNSYSRVVAVDDLIFVSNTAGRDYAAQTMPDDARGQAEQALRNIDGALGAVGSGLADVVRAVLTVPDPADADVVAEVFGEAFSGIDPAFTIHCAPLAGAYRVEIEVTAYRGAGAAEQQRLTVTLS